MHMNLRVILPFQQRTDFMIYHLVGVIEAKVLYAVLLGLCQYITKGIDLLFTKSAIDLVSSVVIGIYNDSRRQSERDLPDLSPFGNGLMSVKALKAKERFLHIYYIYLALQNYHLMAPYLQDTTERYHSEWVKLNKFPPWYCHCIDMRLLPLLH